jgi:hypothetical protein
MCIEVRKSCFDQLFQLIELQVQVLEIFSRGDKSITCYSLSPNLQSR